MHFNVKVEFKNKTKIIIRKNKKEKIKKKERRNNKNEICEKVKLHLPRCH